MLARNFTGSSWSSQSPTGWPLIRWEALRTTIGPQLEQSCCCGLGWSGQQYFVLDRESVAYRFFIIKAEALHLLLEAELSTSAKPRENLDLPVPRFELGRLWRVRTYPSDLRGSHNDISCLLFR